jgi:hypothetical protein
MSDAGDYCIFRQFPIIKQNKISVSNYLWFLYWTNKKSV